MCAYVTHWQAGFCNRFTLKTWLTQPLDTFQIRIQSFAPADSNYFSTGIVAPQQKHTLAAANQFAIKTGANNQLLVSSAAPLSSLLLVSPSGKTLRAVSNKNVISTVGLSAGIYYVKASDSKGHTSMLQFVK
jgi:hypothetical protein